MQKQAADADGNVLEADYLKVLQLDNLLVQLICKEVVSFPFAKSEFCGLWQTQRAIQAVDSEHLSATITQHSTYEEVKDIGDYLKVVFTQASFMTDGWTAINNIT